MASRVIFLDYDGVLNDIPYLIAYHKKPGIHSGADSLDPSKISMLAHLCHSVDAGVVLTSSWRDDIEPRKLLKKAGIRIDGVTPHCYDNRGKEIRQWLIDKHYQGDWIIIDDECADLTDYQRNRLIYTREGSIQSPHSLSTLKLGLQPKHIEWAKAMLTRKFPTQADSEFLDAILSAIENDLLRVMGNINQEDYDDENPFQNTGNTKGYKNDIFEVHAYDWGWDFDDNDQPQPINFRWRDLKIWWYKRMGRGMYTNRFTTHDELAVMLQECLQSLRDEERKHDEFYESYH